MTSFQSDKISEDMRAEKSSSKADLMQDSRIRAVIKEQLYTDLLVGPIVVTMVCLIGWLQFVRGNETKLLVFAMVLWWLNSMALLYLYLHHRKQAFDVRNTPTESTRYLKLLHINLFFDKLGIGVVGLLMYQSKPELALSIISGLMMYLYGTFFKNIAYAKVSQYYPALMVMPLTVYLLFKDEQNSITLAFYFSLNALVLFKYARSIAASIQLPIKQRLELEELTRQLNLERDRADAANAAKSHFFTAASHDARQPLQVISLLFQSLQKSTHIGFNDKSIIDKIDVNLSTIRTLFDRVLDISRIDSGNVEPHMQAMPLQPLFDKFDAQFGELAASKGLWLRFVPTQAWIIQDVELLDRMLSNLIHNAIKYTQSGGVWVAWRAARGRIEVRDTGLGISSEHQLTIFDEFSQINNPARNNESGLGLGLSIVKRLADLTRTPLGLSSKLAVGSTFWLKFSPSQAQHASINKQLDDSNEYNSPLLNLNILFAEDEIQIRELLTDLLTRAGAQVYSCADANEARKAIDNKSKIDLVLTDYRLGESGTGLSIVEYLRAKSMDYKHIPAIILTGDTAVKDLQAIQQLSNCTLLHKPLEFNKLMTEIKQAIT